MLSSTEGRTRVSYRTSIVPDFWIPPFAGRRWLLKTLEDATTDLFRNVEAKAKASGQRTQAQRCRRRCRQMQTQMSEQTLDESDSRHRPGLEA